MSLRLIYLSLLVLCFCYPVLRCVLCVLMFLCCFIFSIIYAAILNKLVCVLMNSADAQMCICMSVTVCRA